MLAHLYYSLITETANKILPWSSEEKNKIVLALDIGFWSLTEHCCLEVD
jgi:hypothetical protein